MFKPMDGIVGGIVQYSRANVQLEGLYREGDCVRLYRRGGGDFTIRETVLWGEEMYNERRYGRRKRTVGGLYIQWNEIDCISEENCIVGGAVQ